jgi:hypothetical protein
MGDADGSLLRTRAPGYQLRLGEADSDLQVFEALVQDGRRALAASDAQGAAGLLAEALALWRGSPLADVPPTPLVEAETPRSSPSCAGSWPTIRCGKACGRC